MTTGMIELKKKKHSRGKQPEEMLDGLKKWLNVGGVTDQSPLYSRGLWTNALKVMRD